MPFAILLRGPAGAGKSTLGELLKKRLPNAVHLDVDRFKHIISLESSKTRSTIAHNVGLYFLKQLMEHEFPIIVEEIFLPEYYQEVSVFLKKLPYTLLRVFITAPLEVLVERDRTRSVKTKGREVISRLHSEIQPIDEDLVIDSSKYSSDEIVEMILAKLK